MSKKPNKPTLLEVARESIRISTAKGRKPKPIDTATNMAMWDLLAGVNKPLAFYLGRTVRDAIMQSPALMLPELAQAVGGLTAEQQLAARLVIERHIDKALSELAG